jgi:hypothetical protein
VQGYDKEQGEHAGRGAQGEGGGGEGKTLAEVKVIHAVQEATLINYFQPFQFW